MKKKITILAMLLIAATAYNQTSRRPANSNKTAQKSNREASSATNKRINTTNQRQRTDAIAKTKPANKRTYHYDQKNAVKKAPTRRQTSYNTQSNRGNSTSAVTTARTKRTTDTREAHLTNHNYARGTHKEIDRTNHQRTRDTRRVTATRPASKYHKEYRSPRVYRESHRVVHHYHHKPAPKVYRAKHYTYRRPSELNIIWTPLMHRHYIRMYPMVKYWHYTNGHRITMVSAYDAEFYRGDVRTVYGRVTEVFYSRNTDEYFLYFGLHYPYQDFTVVLPGYIARRYSYRPERYFDNRHLAVTGLITTFNGEPEIVVKESFQMSLY